MTWVGWVLIVLEVFSALYKVSDNKLAAYIRVVGVVCAALLIVGVLTIGTGHL